MGIEATWNPGRGVWVLDVGTHFSLEDVADVLGKTDFGTARAFLWDLRSLESGPDSTGDLHAVVDLLGQGVEFWQGTRSAVLVTRDFDFGIARMFQVFVERVGIRVQVFRDEAAALDWATGS